MNLRSSGKIAAIAAATLVLELSSMSLAQAQGEDAGTYPNRSIRIVVPASPGGANDIIARLVGQKMSESFGQPVVVENKPGAATMAGADYVARANPDGYTLLISPIGAMAVNPVIYPKMPYVPQRDFAPISLVATWPYLLAVTNSAPIRSVRELIDYTKAHPNNANAGGVSGIFQLTIEMFKQRTGTSIQYIPYKGMNDAIMSLVSGELLLSFVDSGTASSQIKSGQIRALAVTSPARMPSYPDFPTMAEAGVSDMQVLSWSGFLAPAGTPANIVTKLQDEIIRVLKLPDVRERLHGLELDLVGSTSEEFARIIAKDLETWSKVAKAAKVRIEQ